MTGSPATSATQPASWHDGPADDARRSDEHRRLKQQLHQQLVANMNLAAMNNVDHKTLRQEVRRVLEELCQRSSSLLSRADRDRLVAELLDETFGMGPLEPLL